MAGAALPPFESVAIRRKSRASEQYNRISDKYDPSAPVNLENRVRSFTDRPTLPVTVLRKTRSQIQKIKSEPPQSPCIQTTSTSALSQSLPKSTRISALILHTKTGHERTTLHFRIPIRLSPGPAPKGATAARIFQTNPSRIHKNFAVLQSKANFHQHNLTPAQPIN
jgi:hypothetical protein